MTLRLILGLLCLSVALPGCGKKEPKKPTAAAPSASSAAVKLTILVVDDPELAAGISLLRGEWAERSGGELEVDESTASELLAAEQFSADVVIYPSRYLGTLVAREWLRPVRKSLLQDEQLNVQDFLPLVRDYVMRFGGETFALSLGEPPLMLAWEGDLPPEVADRGSIFWNQLDQLRPLRSQARQLQYPLATELIARAVANTDSRGGSAVLFDPETMEPLLQEPPFERALQRLVARQRLETPPGEDLAVGLSWLIATEGETNSTISFSELPGADEVYYRSLDSWGPSEETGPAPTLLGFSGRLASVTRSTRNAVSAFKLLKWLASGVTAAQISQRSGATVWFRTSQVSQLAKWLGEGNVSDATSAVVTKLLSGDKAYVLPRIPGIDAYLQSLDEVVASSIAGDISEAEALREAADRWQAITQKYGQPRQREAYLRHLGLANFAP